MNDNFKKIVGGGISVLILFIIKNADIIFKNVDTIFPRILNATDENLPKLISNSTRIVAKNHLIKDSISDDKKDKKEKLNLIMSKLKATGFKSLSDDEINFLDKCKYLSIDKIATEAITDRALFGQSFIVELKKSIIKVKTDPSIYMTQLKLWEGIVDKLSYDYIPKVVRNKIKEKIKEQFKEAAGIDKDV